ncbi:hypothetical protein [Ahrensia sp. 13_GOM-1096m]|uniref:hypothetical protein n=1 Tax=Ahrensia sp. 13_GOM-1096m TaxID=1380380 RepID=UPI00047EDBA3|nr:hypothetical protein [Ahrensia sp. 13_GOM-1096m]
MNKTVNINEITNAATTDVKNLEEQIDKLWDKITDMERPLGRVSDFIMSMYWITQSQNDDVTSPLTTIALTAEELCRQIEEQRGECFSTLHALKFGKKQTVADGVSA